MIAPVLVIDTHVHIYAEDSVRYPSIGSPVQRPGKSESVSTLEALTKKNNVAGVCILHPLSSYGWDNRFLCSVSKARSKHMAAVCALDPDDANSPELLSRYVTDYGVRGLRSYPARNGRLDHPGVQALWRKAHELGIVVNVSATREMTDDLASMLEKFPRLPVVIDHCFISKPSPDGAIALADMIWLAKFANVYAKLSFLPLASVEDYPFRDMHEPCKRIIAAYGPERCVWGNCHPCELWSPKSTYSQNLRLFTHELDLPNSARISILGRTALRLWFGGKLQSTV